MRGHLATSKSNRLTAKLVTLYALVATFVSAQSAKAGPAPGPEASLVQRASHAGTVISVVVIGVVALVGILIFAQVEDAVPDTADENLSDSMDSVTEGFGSAIEFVPIILLVMLASVVILVVQRMRA